MMELSAKERVLLAFQHKEADSVPIYSEARNVAFIERMSGRKLTGSREQMEIITADAYAKAGIVVLRRLLTPQWGVVKGKNFDVQRDGYLNWKIGGENKFTLEEAVEHIKKWRRPDNGSNPKDETYDRIKEVNRLQGILGDRILFMPAMPVSQLESTYHTIGIENFCIIMYDYSEVLDEALERNMHWALECVEVLNNIYDGPVIHAGDDMGMKGRTLFSPVWLRQHVFPRMKVVADKIKQGGKYLNFHSCGNVTEIIPDLIDVGIDSLNPIELTAGMDLKQVKQQYGDKLVVIGNADTNILQMGSVEDVRKEVRRCLDDAAGGGGYFLNGAITQVAPVENLLAYFDEARSYTGWRTK